MLKKSSHAEQVNSALFAISDAINTTEDLDELYMTIHHILGRIIDVTNFFIAIVDSKKQTLYFPYYVDTFDDDFSPINDFDTNSSLTGLVVAKRKPTLLGTEALQQRAAGEGIWGPLPLTWMGVPLVIRDEVIGVVAVQSYTDADIYGESDLHLLTAVSQQIAVAIDRKRFLDKLKKSEEQYRELVENANSIILRMDNAGRITFFNEFAQSFFGYKADEIIGKSLIGTIVPPTDSATIDLQNLLLNIGSAPQRYMAYETENICQDGTRVSISWNFKPIFRSPGEISEILSIGNDITERKRAEEEKKKLQMQLAQAHKMESVGRLAGGVAHDFNNMLGVILGHTELALNQLDPTQPLFNNLKEINKAATRSADLTKQLLAFARKQTVAPKVINLNETVDGMLTMLRRLIGEDIHLTWLPGMNLEKLNIDPSQIDQILANLCVNARDAIGDTGKITIETNNVIFTETYCMAQDEDLTPEHVLLAVSDNGCGMSPETISHLFEPFFTTKGLGRGTGLGLATVYGIVKQNNGFINVYSELEQGTTIKIYLPRHAAKGEGVTKEQSLKPVTPGHETILLVEDELMILELTQTMLEYQGYKVLAAATPGEAINLAREHAGEINLLMTDVIMPEMNGRNLAKNLLSIYPDLKRLFMSGYTANVIAHHGVLDQGVHFIQKPFTLADLAAKIRAALDDDC